MLDNIRILIIEDEEIWMHVLIKMLLDFGFEVTATAETFEEAILALNKDNYDIAIVDIKMENNNKGLELGKMINTLYKKPFIFITGSHDSHTLQEASIALPSAYLTKPPNPSTLFISIQNAINRFENVSATTQIAEAAPEFIFVKQGTKYKKLYWRDIVILNSDKNYTLLLNTIDHIEYPIRSTLPKTLKWVIPAYYQSRFIQINRNQAIQIAYIDEVNGDTIKTKFGSFFLGDAYGKQFREKMKFQV